MVVAEVVIKQEGRVVHREVRVGDAPLGFDPNTLATPWSIETRSLQGEEEYAAWLAAGSPESWYPPVDDDDEDDLCPCCGQ